MLLSDRSVCWEVEGGGVGLSPPSPPPYPNMKNGSQQRFPSNTYERTKHLNRQLVCARVHVGGGGEGGEEGEGVYLKASVLL